MHPQVQITNNLHVVPVELVPSVTAKRIRKTMTSSARTSISKTIIYDREPFVLDLGGKR